MPSLIPRDFINKVKCQLMDEALRQIQTMGTTLFTHHVDNYIEDLHKSLTEKEESPPNRTNAVFNLVRFLFFLSKRWNKS